MSLPGVESARRRRASHGRSSVGYVQPPPLRRRSSPHPAPASLNPPLRFLPDPPDQYRGILNERALAARHRLDERLRDPAAYRPHTIHRRHDASSISRTVVDQPRAKEKLHSRVMNEGKLVKMVGGQEQQQQQQEEDCPVCLDSFIAGQTVVYLPCHHTFHSDCIVPWLQNHCHCPSCRAQIS